MESSSSFILFREMLNVIAFVKDLFPFPYGLYLCQILIEFRDNLCRLSRDHCIGLHIPGNHRARSYNRIGFDGYPGG